VLPFISTVNTESVDAPHPKQKKNMTARPRDE
jgi:hypothetical protein